MMHTRKHRDAEVVPEKRPNVRSRKYLRRNRWLHLSSLVLLQAKVVSSLVGSFTRFVLSLALWVQPMMDRLSKAEKLQRMEVAPALWPYVPVHATRTSNATASFCFSALPTYRFRNDIDNEPCV